MFAGRSYLTVTTFCRSLLLACSDLKVIVNPPLQLWKERKKSHKEHYTRVHQLSSWINKTACVFLSRLIKRDNINMNALHHKRGVGKKREKETQPPDIIAHLTKALVLLISCFWMEYTFAQMYKYMSYFSRSVTVLTLQLICLSKDTSSAGVMSGCHHEKMLQSLHPAAICRAEITNVNVFVFCFFLKQKNAVGCFCLDVWSSGHIAHYY